MNRIAVTLTFQSARVAGWKTGATKLHGLMATMRVQGWKSRLSMNGKVGRVTPCAPKPADPIANGAHGVTRPTSANRFMASIRVESLEALRFPMNHAGSERGCPQPQRATIIGTAAAGDSRAPGK